MLAMTKRMYDAGVPILAGTDAYRRNHAASRVGTGSAGGHSAGKVAADRDLERGAVTEAGHRIGSIFPGKRADFVLVEGNPAEHISDIRRCRMVMKDGTLYNSAEMYQAVGIQPAQ